MGMWAPKRPFEPSYIVRPPVTRGRWKSHLRGHVTFHESEVWEGDEGTQGPSQSSFMVRSRLKRPLEIAFARTGGFLGIGSAGEVMRERVVGNRMSVQNNGGKGGGAKLNA